MGAGIESQAACTASLGAFVYKLFAHSHPEIRGAVQGDQEIMMLTAVTIQ